MVKLVPTTTRRTMLGALITSAAGAVSSGGDLLGVIAVDDGKLPTLRRTYEGRNLSRARYHNAAHFLSSLDNSVSVRANDFLYRSGIVAQLALSAHLLDVGFADMWCAKHIGLHVSKSLTYANASGFGYDCPNMKRLAVILSPYGQWRNPPWMGFGPSDDGFTPEMILPLLRHLLERVGHVTGHRLPRAVLRP